MECPFSEDQFVNTKREELEERAFQEAMATLKRKIDRYRIKRKRGKGANQ